jgi:hypothetical protein
MRSRTLSIHGAAAFSAALAVAAGAWSCGGSLPSPTAPAVLSAGGEEGGGVEASAAHKITVCHKGKDLKVAAAALGGHLAHGDRLGSCTPAVACPCFTAAGIADVAAQCSGTLLASCPATYSVQLFCAPSGGSGTIGNLGLFEARLGTDSCSTTFADSTTGNPVTVTLPVSPEQFEACRKAIVDSPVYPSSCPA